MSLLTNNVKASEEEDEDVEEVEEDGEIDPEEDGGDEEDEDEEDVEDPQELLREECASRCTKYQKELDICTDRVTSRSNTTETCEQELYDFIHCRDEKVAKTIFTKLK
ncbi:cytochrome b-c1 complex subunit 6, mitochondrial-like [Watersipora subatra]|uniref:cytochrome b-c1 complex subunit 6, mitochondrial-like n=1 Tax=Watersipora subatra TaxID=2589382 RepID=UPI00355B30E8